MKLTAILLTTLLLLAGCTQQTELPKDGSIDLSRFAPAILNTIRVEGGSTTATLDGGSDATTRATGTAPVPPLPVGRTFRLYAFAKGVTDVSKVITTRTYTIAATEGAPVMDAGQDPLYLPLGEVDIYLVGPIDVATDHGVFPQHGVDLIASKTEIRVEPNVDNAIVPNPLIHKMAKMEVVVQRPTDAVYQDMLVNTIQLKNQSLTGDYIFGPDGGAVTPADEGNETLEPTIIEQTKGETYLISELMIPRKDVYMKVGVFFVCNISATEQVSRRMESGTLKYPLVAGQVNRFITKPNISTDLLFRYRLLPWDEVLMPEEELHPNQAMLFSYSGADAPVERGGKRYWPDRSGNGRDAELVGNVKYNDAEHYYYTTDLSAYIRVPSLDYLPAYTMELMATSELGGKGTPVMFYNSSYEGSDNLSLEVSLPTYISNEVAFHTDRSVGGSTSSNVYSNDKGYMENIATWAFAKSPTEMSIRRNGMAWGLPLNITGKTIKGSFINNKLLKGPYPDWNSSKIKLYGARMSSSYLADDVLKKNHRNDMMVVKQLDTDQGGGYVRDGLMLDLQGDVAPQTIAGKTVWEDQSGMGNHAEIINATHDAVEHCYAFGSNKYMKLIKSLGTNQSFTVEMVVQAPREGSTVMLHFSSVDNTTAFREFFMHYPLGYSAGAVFFIDTPFNNDRGNNIRTSKPLSTLPYAIDSKHQLSVTRTVNVAQGINMRSCGVLVTNETATNTPINEMKYCYLGCFADKKTSFWTGKLYALRFYNRVLTDAERQLNYQLDKEKYNLLK